MTHCPRCFEPLLHGGDDDFESLGFEGAGIASNFTCVTCRVRVDVFFPEVEETQQEAIDRLTTARHEEAPSFDSLISLTERLGPAGNAILIHKLNEKLSKVEADRDRFREMMKR